MRAYLKSHPMIAGFVGMALALVMGLAGFWTYRRYQEFVVMRSVISQVLEAQQQRARQAPPQAPMPKPEGTTK